MIKGRRDRMFWMLVALVICGTDLTGQAAEGYRAGYLRADALGEACDYLREYGPVMPDECVPVFVAAMGSGEKELRRVGLRFLAWHAERSDAYRALCLMALGGASQGRRIASRLLDIIDLADGGRFGEEVVGTKVKQWCFRWLVELGVQGGVREGDVARFLQVAERAEGRAARAAAYLALLFGSDRAARGGLEERMRIRAYVEDLQVFLWEACQTWGVRDVCEVALQALASPERLEDALVERLLVDDHEDVSCLLDCVEEAFGVLEHLGKGGGLWSLRKRVFDKALDRGLVPETALQMMEAWLELRNSSAAERVLGRIEADGVQGLERVAEIIADGRSGIELLLREDVTRLLSRGVEMGSVKCRAALVDIGAGVECEALSLEEKLISQSRTAPFGRSHILHAGGVRELSGVYGDLVLEGVRGGLQPSSAVQIVECAQVWRAHEINWRRMWDWREIIWAARAWLAGSSHQSGWFSAMIHAEEEGYWWLEGCRGLHWATVLQGYAGKRGRVGAFAALELAVLDTNACNTMACILKEAERGSEQSDWQATSGYKEDAIAYWMQVMGDPWVESHVGPVSLWVEQYFWIDTEHALYPAGEWGMWTKRGYFRWLWTRSGGHCVWSAGALSFVWVRN